MEVRIVIDIEDFLIQTCQVKRALLLYSRTPPRNPLRFNLINLECACIMNIGVFGRTASQACTLGVSI